MLVPAVPQALEFNRPSEDALDQEHLHRLGQLLQQSSSTSLSGDRSSCGPVDEQSDSSFIFTRREAARATAITRPSPKRDTDASPPRKRLLRDLSDESDGRLGSQADESAYQLFASASRSASPLLPLSLAPDVEMNDQLESMVDESAGESEDEPVQLAEGEEEMVMDVPVQQPVSPESQSPPRTYTSSTPTSTLPKHADGDDCTLSPDLAHRLVPSAALGAFLSSRANKPVKPTVLAKQLPTVNDSVSGGASPSPREDEPANLVDLPENLAVLVDESPLFDDGGQVVLHAVGGQKLLNNHKGLWSLSLLLLSGLQLTASLTFPSQPGSHSLPPESIFTTERRLYSLRIHPRPPTSPESTPTSRLMSPSSSIHSPSSLRSSQPSETSCPACAIGSTPSTSSSPHRRIETSGAIRFARQSAN